MDTRPKLNKVGAMWRRFSKSGEEFFSGALKIDGQEYKFLVFSNKNKAKENQPDLIIMSSEIAEEIKIPENVTF